MSMNDQEYSEYQAENALQEYNSDEFSGFSEYKKEKIRKALRAEITFLKNNYPDSYFLTMELPEGF